MTRSETVVRTLALVASSMLFSGCASQQTVPQEDRWEGMNRVIYGFNDGVDRVLLKPIARGYRFITPDPVERGVRNVFGNLAYPTVIVNNLLQGKPGAAISDTGRFIVNSTVGVAGIFDVASNIGLEEHDEDFGQTLAVWGVGSGPYVVLPFLGPSTLRDAFGIPADRATNVIEHLDDASIEDKLTVLQIISLRASLLSLDDQVNASSDPYLFVREAYLQRRNFQIYDGEPPVEEEDFEIEDDFDADL